MPPKVGISNYVLRLAWVEPWDQLILDSEKHGGNETATPANETSYFEESLGSDCEKLQQQTLYIPTSKEVGMCWKPYEILHTTRLPKKLAKPYDSYNFNAWAGKEAMAT